MMKNNNKYKWHVSCALNNYKCGTIGILSFIGSIHLFYVYNKDMNAIVYAVPVACCHFSHMRQYRYDKIFEKVYFIPVLNEIYNTYIK